MHINFRLNNQNRLEFCVIYLHMKDEFPHDIQIRMASNIHQISLLNITGRIFPGKPITNVLNLVVILRKPTRHGFLQTPFSYLCAFHQIHNVGVIMPIWVYIGSSNGLLPDLTIIITYPKDQWVKMLAMRLQSVNANIRWTNAIIITIMTTEIIMMIMMIMLVFTLPLRTVMRRPQCQVTLKNMDEWMVWVQYTADISETT